MYVKTKHRILCLALSLTIVICFLPLNVLAAITPKSDWYSSSATTFTISTTEELYGFASLVNGGNSFTGKTVKLTADIILNENSNSYFSWDTFAPANVWVPIGNSTNAFKGVFDGGNHTVAGIYINSSTDYQGLFGYNTGTIKNLGIINSYIKAKEGVGSVAGYTNEGNIISNCYSSNCIITANRGVGGVVGYNYNGTMQDCYNTSTVQATTDYSGGVVGFNNGDIIGCYNSGIVSGEFCVGGVAGGAYNGTATNCFNTGDVRGTIYHIGGVFGLAFNETVNKCYNTGAVKSNNQNAGGVIGFAVNSTVANSYNTGTIEATMYSGGIVGNHQFGEVTNCYNLGAIIASNQECGGITAINAASITNCYNLGTIYGTYSGGIAANNTNGTITNCYSAATGSGYLSGGIVSSTNVGIINNCYYDDDLFTGTNENGNPLITPNIKQISNLVGFDPNIWVNAPTQYAANGVFSDSNPVNYGYPVLKAFGYTGVDTSIYTEFEMDTNGTTYLIKNAYQLDLVRYDGGAGKSYKLANDIDLSPSQYNQIKNIDGSWQAIGRVGSIYWGTFDGNNNKIFNIHIEGSTERQGLFGASSATIQNVGMVNGDIQGTNYIGGIVGINYGVIYNCYNTCTIRGNQYLGGIAGNSNLRIFNCYNSGMVLGNSFCGGIVGQNYDNTALLYNCYNTGEIAGLNAIGGIAGHNLSSISSCYNIGTASAMGAKGGIVGTNDGRVTSCYNIGKVNEDNNYSGAIAGNNFNIVANSYYSGNNVGIGKSSISPVGATPFVKDITLTVGTSSTIPSQPVWAAAGAMGANFTVNYANLSSSLAQLTGNTLTATSAGTSTETSTINITQNELTSAGFTGSVKTISAPISFVLTVQKATPTINITTSQAGNTLTINAAITNAYNPTGYINYKIGTTSIGGTAINASGVSTINYTILGGESLNITADYAGDINNNSANGILVHNVPKFNQSTLAIINIPPLIKIGDGNFTLTTTGGSGTGAVTYTSDNTNVLDVNATTGEATVNGVGSATTTVTKVGDSNFNTTTGFATITVQKATPTIGLSASTVDNIVTIAATLIHSYNPTGDISFNIGSSSIGASSINASGSATVNYTVSGGENLNITAEYLGDANNESTVSTAYNYNVNKFAQNALSITNVPSSIKIGDGNFTLATTGGSGSGNVTYTSSDANVLAVNSATGKVTVKGIGSATITAEKASDSNYNSTSEIVTLSVQKMAPAITITAKMATDTMLQVKAVMTNSFNPTGEIIFKIGASSALGSTININGEGYAYCNVKPGDKLILSAEYAGDANNEIAVSNTLQYVVTKLPQKLLIITNAPTNVTVGDGNFTLATTGGTGSGALTYSSSNNNILSVNATTGEVTVKGAGTAIITATKAEDSNYNSASASVTITVNADTSSDSSDNSSSTGTGSSGSASQAATEAKTITVTEAPSSVGGASQIQVNASANAFSQSVEVKVNDDAATKQAIQDAIKANKAALPKDAKIYPLDISVFAKGTDTKVQPNEGETVEITMPIPNELLADKDYIVVVCVVDGKLQVLSTKIVEKDGKFYAVFNASHFSPYALVVDKANKLTAPTKTNPPTGIK